MAAALGGGAAQGTEDAAIESTGFDYPEIVVNGRVRRCRSVEGDPLDAVKVGQSKGLMTIVPDGQGGFAWLPNAEQLTGPEFWQRVGVGMDRYVFRAPAGNKPMCVGGRRALEAFAGFRRIVDATPYRGHRLRFTAWVATEKADQVSFWLTAGTVWREKPSRHEKPRPNQLLNGGNTNHVPFGGNRGWTPVLIETGPIHADAHHVSYGFNLQASGDVWVHEPRLEIVADQPGQTETGDRIVIGSEPH